MFKFYRGNSTRAVTLEVAPWWKYVPYPREVLNRFKCNISILGAFINHIISNIYIYIYIYFYRKPYKLLIFLRLTNGFCILSNTIHFLNLIPLPSKIIPNNHLDCINFDYFSFIYWIHYLYNDWVWVNYIIYN